MDSNGDVYLGGSEGPGLDRRAAYWKNGEMTAITEYANACIGEMFVLDGETIIIYRRDYNHIFRTERGRKHNCQMLHER